MKPKNPIKAIKERIASKKEYKSQMEQYKKDLQKSNALANPRDLGGNPPRMPLSPRQQRQIAKGNDINKPAKKTTEPNYTVVKYKEPKRARGMGKPNYSTGASRAAQKRNKQVGVDKSCKSVIKRGRKP